MALGFQRRRRYPESFGLAFLIWYARWESNPQTVDFKSPRYANSRHLRIIWRKAVNSNHIPIQEPTVFQTVLSPTQFTFH
jgi:hypothetical protein